MQFVRVGAVDQEIPAIAEAENGSWFDLRPLARDVDGVCETFNPLVALGNPQTQFSRVGDVEMLGMDGLGRQQQTFQDA